jgi:hypothetical protein
MSARREEGVVSIDEGAGRHDQLQGNNAQKNASSKQVTVFKV